MADERADGGDEGVVWKGLVRDGEKGEWGSAWRAGEGIAPLERPVAPPIHRVGTPTAKGGEMLGPGREQRATTTSWSAFFAEKILGASEEDYAPSSEDDHESDHSDSDDHPRRDSRSMYYDGIKPHPAGGVGTPVSFGGKERGWKEVRLETVECEVPVGVWPGNTAYKAVDVVFDV